MNQEQGDPDIKAFEAWQAKQGASADQSSKPVKLKLGPDEVDQDPDVQDFDAWADKVYADYKAKHDVFGGSTAREIGYTVARGVEKGAERVIGGYANLGAWLLDEAVGLATNHSTVRNELMGKYRSLQTKVHAGDKAAIPKLAEVRKQIASFGQPYEPEKDAEGNAVPGSLGPTYNQLYVDEKRDQLKLLKNAYQKTAKIAPETAKVFRAQMGRIIGELKKAAPRIKDWEWSMPQPDVEKRIIPRIETDGMFRIVKKLQSAEDTAKEVRAENAAVAKAHPYVTEGVDRIADVVELADYFFGVTGTGIKLAAKAPNALFRKALGTASKWSRAGNQVGSLAFGLGAVEYLKSEGDPEAALQAAISAPAIALTGALGERMTVALLKKMSARAAHGVAGLGEGALFAVLPEAQSAAVYGALTAAGIKEYDLEKMAPLFVNSYRWITETDRKKKLKAQEEFWKATRKAATTSLAMGAFGVMAPSQIPEYRRDHWKEVQDELLKQVLAKEGLSLPAPKEMKALQAGRETKALPAGRELKALPGAEAPKKLPEGPEAAKSLPAPKEVKELPEGHRAKGLPAPESVKELPEGAAAPKELTGQPRPKDLPKWKEPKKLPVPETLPTPTRRIEGPADLQRKRDTQLRMLLATGHKFHVKGGNLKIQRPGWEPVEFSDFDAEVPPYLRRARMLAVASRHLLRIPGVYEAGPDIGVYRVNTGHDHGFATLDIEGRPVLRRDGRYKWEKWIAPAASEDVVPLSPQEAHLVSQWDAAMQGSLPPESIAEWNVIAHWLSNRSSADMVPANEVMRVLQDPNGYKVAQQDPAKFTEALSEVIVTGRGEDLFRILSEGRAEEAKPAEETKPEAKQEQEAQPEETQAKEAEPEAKPEEAAKPEEKPAVELEAKPEEKPAAKPEKKEAENEGLESFVVETPKLSQKRRRDTLLKVKKYNGEEMPRHVFIEDAVANGAQVKEKDGKRILENKDGGSMSKLTKTELDYAEYLAERRTEAEAKPEPAEKKSSKPEKADLSNPEAGAIRVPAKEIIEGLGKMAENVWGGLKRGRELAGRGKKWTKDLIFDPTTPISRAAREAMIRHANKENERFAIANKELFGLLAKAIGPISAVARAGKRLSVASDITAYIEGTGNLLVGKDDTHAAVSSRLNAKQKAVAKKLSKRLEDLFQMQVENGLLDEGGHWENYMRHFYKPMRKDGTEARIGEVRNALKKNVSHGKKRKYASYMEAFKKAGLVPKTMDAFEIVAKYEAEAYRVKMNRELLGALEDMGIVQGPYSKRFGEGGDLNKSDYRQYRDVAMRDYLSMVKTEKATDLHAKPMRELVEIARSLGVEKPYALKKADLIKAIHKADPDIAVGTGSKTVPDMQGGYKLVHKDAYADLGKVLEPHMDLGKFVTAWKLLSQSSKAVILSLSGFHPFTLTQSFVMSGGAGLLPGMADVVKALRPGGVTVEMMADAAKHGVQIGHGTIDVDKDLIDRTLGSVSQAARRWGVPGRVMSIPSDVMRSQMRILNWTLWDYMHPRFKVYRWHDWMKRLEKKHAKDLASGKVTREELGREAARRVNDSLGGQNWNEYFRFMKLKWARGMAHLSQLSPDWTLSVGRQNAFMAKSIATMVPGAKSGNLDPLMRKQALNWALAAFVATPIVQAFVSWAFLDEKEKAKLKERGQPFLGIYSGDNKAGEMQTIEGGKQLKESERMFMDPMSFFAHKANPLLKEFVKQATGYGMGDGFPSEWKMKDLAGADEFWSRVKSLVSNWVPISLKGKSFGYTVPLTREITPWGVKSNLVKALKTYAVVDQKNAASVLDDIQEILKVGRRNNVELSRELAHATTAIRMNAYRDAVTAINEGRESDLRAIGKRMSRLGMTKDMVKKSLGERFHRLVRDGTARYSYRGWTRETARFTRYVDPRTGRKLTRIKMGLDREAARRAAAVKRYKPTDK